MSLAGRTIRAFLLDVTGVLYDGKCSIEGSIRALEWWAYVHLTTALAPILWWNIHDELQLDS